MILIINDLIPVFRRDPLAEAIRIIARPASHCEDRSAIRIDSHRRSPRRHDTAMDERLHLYFHCVLCRFLQIRIQRQTHTVPRDRRRTAHIADRLTRCIDLDRLCAILAFEIIVIAALKARTTDQCRGRVRISFRIPVIRPRFADIAKDLRPRIAQRIYAQRIHFYFDAREFILLLFDLRRDIDADIVCQIDRSEGQLIVFDLFLDIGSRHMKKLRQAAECLIR